MSDQSKRLTFLFGKYAAGDASAEELQEFWQLLATHGEDEGLSAEMQSWWGKEELKMGDRGEKILHRVLAAPRNPRRYYPLRAAAAAVLLIGCACFYYLHRHQAAPMPMAKVARAAYKNDVMPGVTGATLTLADGTVVPLDSAGAGLSLMQGSTQVAAVNGTVEYKGNATSAALLYNTLTTRRGQQYPVKLSDGTLAILDAGSSITYPAGFPADRREVTVTGQVWFDIATDASRPFIVKHNNRRIEVLGTSFNIKAYEEEPGLEVTLVSGSVRVTNGTASQVLRPGQQAVLSNNSTGITLAAADVATATAWKDGNFEYKSRSLTYVMQDISRWYDIEIVYEGAQPTDTFTGGFSRSVTLTELLTILEMSRVHFKLEGRKLTVLSR